MKSFFVGFKKSPTLVTFFFKRNSTPPSHHVIFGWYLNHKLNVSFPSTFLAHRIVAFSSHLDFLRFVKEREQMLDEVYVASTCQSFFGTAPSAYQWVPESPSFNMLKVTRLSLSRVHRIFFRIDKLMTLVTSA